MRAAIAAVLSIMVASQAMAAPQAVRVVELFQSQGCSSCPPANANLNAIAGRADLIALSYSVTYWDYLGWKDSFAKPAFTERQRAYGRTLGNANVYTPQMVVNGRADFVGASSREVSDKLASASALPGTLIKVEGGKAAARAGVAAELWLVGYDPSERQVAISRGENGGRTLPHRNVVKSLVRLGAADGTQLAIPAAVAGEARVLLLQARGVGPILDAVRL
jgi:hypothetical protein